MTNDSQVEPDWNGVDEAVAREILRQAEKYLSSQWQAGIAADQRAVTAASIFITIAVAAMGGAMAYWTTAGHDIHIVTAGVLTGVCLTVAAVICFWSARPVDFYAPGNEPAEWWAAMKNSSLVECIGGETENLQRHIVANNATLRKRGRQFGQGFYIALAAPAIAVLYWFFATSSWVLVSMVQAF